MSYDEIDERDFWLDEIRAAAEAGGFLVVRREDAEEAYETVDEGQFAVDVPGPGRYYTISVDAQEAP